MSEDWVQPLALLRLEVVDDHKAMQRRYVDVATGETWAAMDLATAQKHPEAERQFLRRWLFPEGEARG